jgi:peptidoglycan hydrolase-like protein with peptidoglycan-binding domain
MKFSPTITLALALAAGMAGAAAAQTAQTPSTSTAQPEATAAQAQQPAAQTQQPATQAQQPAAQAQPNMQTGSTSPTMQQPAAGRAATSQAQGAAPGVTADHVRYAQQQLSAMGLYKGPADGRMDPDTRAALANFQQQHGLRRTSDLDQQTYARLTAGQTQGSGASMAPTATAPAGAGGNTGGGQQPPR